jgi:RimJ/RimL family protein N-acetyltransferase
MDRTGIINIAGPLQLQDGRRVWFRSIESADADRLRAFHRRLSAETQRLRFFTPLRELSPKMAEYFCNVDGQKRRGIVVSYPGEQTIRGVGRYEESADGTAEVAFVMEDGLQGFGIGKALLHLLAQHAMSRGITKLTATVLPENCAMLGLFRGCEFPATFTHDDGTSIVTLDLTQNACEREPLLASA